MRFLSGAAAVFILALSLARVVWAGEGSGETISLEQYWELVHRSAGVVQAQKGVSEIQAHTALLEAAEKWEAVSAVSLPDGSSMAVDTGSLVAALRAAPPDLDGLEKRFAALLAEEQAWPAPAFSAQDVASLSPILAQPEFQWVENLPSPLEEWFAEQLNRFLGWLADLFSTDAAAAGGRLFEYALIALGVLAVTLVLAYATRGLWGSLVSESVLGPEAGQDDEPLSAESALKKAQSLSAGGDLRLAVRYLYLSSLLTLEERGLLRYDRSKTNRETLGAIANQPEMRAEMQEVVDVFDRVWYGYQELEQEDYDDYQDHVVRLRQQK